MALRLPALVSALLVVSAIGAVSPALAEDCRDPVDQGTMNRCAENDYRAADQALNTQYRVTRKAVAEVDADGERLLVTAQKAWIVFRDAHCRTAAQAHKGGSMEPLIWFSCLTSMTEARRSELHRLVSDYGN